MSMRIKLARAHGQLRIDRAQAVAKVFGAVDPIVDAPWQPDAQDYQVIDAILDAMREPSEGVKATWTEHTLQNDGEGGAWVNSDDVAHNFGVVIDAIKRGA